MIARVGRRASAPEHSPSCLASPWRGQPGRFGSRLRVIIVANLALCLTACGANATPPLHGGSSHCAGTRAQPSGVSIHVNDGPNVLPHGFITDPPPPPQRIVQAIANVAVAHDQTITISGANFGSQAGEIFFNQDANPLAWPMTRGCLVSWSDTEVRVVVPENARRGPVVGVRSPMGAAVDFPGWGTQPVMFSTGNGIVLESDLNGVEQLDARELDVHRAGEPTRIEIWAKDHEGRPVPGARIQWVVRGSERVMTVETGVDGSVITSMTLEQGANAYFFSGLGSTGVQIY